ncbi:uncharacterized protein LOC113291328 [Papaver somniferum]|uniref:uncharacterized protein LOC113291328 n=1 Tax=Papaver somniferum TaxID=3469 RepID=UPI000E6FA318|nr:uncharacterized protein LOC113291328 [Papaver somniferum]
MDVDPVCGLCNSMLEDDYHLFFGCSYSSDIWRYLQRLMGLRETVHTDWDDQIRWCVEDIKGVNAVGTIKKLIFNAYIYHILGERNRRTFTQISVHASVIFYKIIDDVRLRMASCKASMPDCNESRDLAARMRCTVEFYLPTQKDIIWQKPETGEVAINSDGSLCDEGAGYGATIRDEHDTPLGVVTGSTVPSSITVHELQGIEAGLQLAQLKGFPKVFIQTDSMTALRYLKEDGSKPPWTCHHVWESIKRLKAQFARCSSSHTCREANGSADLIASFRLDGSRFVEIHPSSFPEEKSSR